MNKLVMNFFVTEVHLQPQSRKRQGRHTHVCVQGYVKAAKMFEEETGTPAGIDLDSIADRMEIRRCIQTGQVESAIDRVNDLNPEV